MTAPVPYSRQVCACGQPRTAHDGGVGECHRNDCRGFRLPKAGGTS